ncbi:MAG TPA: protein kinase, partial [Clostridia bacterium]|nr:protein kinase [Clostridia bacterium]
MIGRVLANRYEIQERIGVGGMAYVYRALDRNTQKMVAVKILREELTNDDEFVQRFEREARAASKMSHPNVVNLLDVGTEEDMRYIVIEYVSGRSLKEMIRESGGLRSEMAGQITVRILSALQHAHQNGIIHRDIKPQNILLDKEGVIKVLDFGIARIMNDAQVQERTIGSVHYFSPEQARGETADEKSDLYSVGVVLYEMLTGKIPFQGDSTVSVAMQHLQDKPVSPEEINPNVSAALSRVALKAMEKDPAKRYQNASEMIRATRDALRKPDPERAAPKPAPSKPDGETDEERERRIAKRVKWMRRILTGAFSALLLFVIGLLVYTMVGNLLHSIANRTVMPNVTNMSRQPAINLLEERGFVVHTREQSVEIGGG